MDDSFVKGGITLTPIIDLNQISYRYPDAPTPAVDQVSMQIKRGQWVAIVGHNGSGKSTLTRIINGLLEPQQGEVRIAGVPLTEETVWDIRQQIGIVFQSPDNQFVGATVADDVAFGMENNGVPRSEMLPRVDEALSQVKMSAYRHHEPARLSGGQKQRVALAGVLAQRPQVIILDEATSMLDPQGRDDVMSLIKQLKATGKYTIVAITHDINEAALADRLFLMDDGQLITQGTPAELFMQPDLLIQHGLTIPLSEQVRLGLQQQGVPVSDHYLDEKQLVKNLWTLRLTK